MVNKLSVSGTMSAPVFPPQRTLPRSCSSSVELCPHSFESGLVLREQNCFINQGSQNDYLDSFDGSFCDVTETLDDSSYEGDTEVPDLKLVRKIVSQVEFYLSDENLSHDAFLLKHVQKNKMGYVSIKLLTSFKKVKNLTRDWRKTLYALQFSEILEINEEQTKVRRKIPIPDILLGLPPTKLLLAWNFDDTEQRPPTCPQTLMETVTSLFAPYGVVTSVRILKPGKEIPCYIKKYISRYPELATKRCALVEYENLEGARKALEALGLKQCSADFSFKVIPVSGRGIRKNSGMESDEIEDSELPNKKVLKTQRRPSERSLYAMDDVAFYSSSESDSTPASPVLLPRYLSSSNFASPSAFKPHSFSSPRSSPLLARKNLTQPHHHNPSPLAAELTSGFFSSPGTSPEIYRRIPEFSLDSGFGSTSPWVQRRKAAAHNQRSENKTLPCSPLAVKNSTISIGVPNGILRLPRGPDGSKGFHNNIGRGRLVLRH
ncbi:la-related protein 6-like [Spea bombifrons]|uniref:la-related protein 6-like n=1 Tax=Spea bombifrons TaxID=233779 RepID=UPI002349B195|nr:la-related protein 6-like [Spea bombifrons]